MPVRAHEASEYLRTPEHVAAYLNAAIDESDGDPRLLMKTFRNVAAAPADDSAIARRAEVDRVALSRGLSGNRDPRLPTVTKIAAACPRVVAVPAAGGHERVRRGAAAMSAARGTLRRQGRGDPLGGWPGPPPG